MQHSDATFEVEELWPVTSPRDFGTGAKWHAYMQPRRLLCSSLSPPSSSSPVIFLPCHLKPHLSFSATWQTVTLLLQFSQGFDGSHRHENLHRSAHGLACLHCEFFSFLFPILLPPKSIVPPTWQWGSTPLQYHNGQQLHCTHVAWP